VALTLPTVEVYFDGVNPTDISEFVYSVDFTRGRSRELDDVAAGVCTVGLRNHTGRFVPYDVAIEGSEILDQLGDPILDQLGNAILDQTASAFATNIVPGKRARVTTEGVVVFDGKIDDWNYVYQPAGGATASFEAVDAFGDLARRTFNEWTATGSQRAGARITDILARPEVAYAGTTSLAKGKVTLQGNLITAGRNVLDELKLIARTDTGILFASRTNVLTYLDRGSLANPSPVFTFTDDKMHGIEPGFGRELLFNLVRVSRAGGATVTADNAASQASYDIRTLDRTGMLFEYDHQATNMARYLVALYAQPKTRIEAMTVVLNELSSGDQEDVLELDIGSCVEVSWTPEALTSPVDQTLVVEGISHSVSANSTYSIQFRMSQPAQTDAFILDSADFGVLDVNRLSF
jgi:hypothetical protein